ncbi:MAG: hypothetical protein JRC68_10180 [Deltaproteobacteria bacterium]|nr:hypothetical protein [Deltaproteobacteria bacterium]
MKDTLQDAGFDGEFQRKLIRVLAGSTVEFRRFAELIEPWMFEVKVVADVYEALRNYYTKYGCIPDTTDQRVLFVEEFGPEKGKEMCDLLVVDVNESGAFVLGKTREFMAERIFLEHANTSLALIKKKNIMGAYSEMEAGMRKRSMLDGEDRGVVYDPDVYYFHSDRGDIPTGITELDSLLKGGMKKTELLLLIALTGGGKTTGLIHFGKTGMIVGHRVMHYTYEHEENYTLAKYDLSIFGFPEGMDIASKFAWKQRGRAVLKKDRLMVKRCLPGIWGYKHLRGHLQQQLEMGW